MKRLKNQNGFTLIEIIIASAMIGMVFVLMGSLYVTAIRMMRVNDFPLEVNALIALERICRDAKIASAAVANTPGPSGNLQLQLRVDRQAVQTPETTDDEWVSYAFVNAGGGTFRLRTRTAAVGAPAENVIAADPEVSPGLPFFCNAGQSRFLAVGDGTSRITCFLWLDNGIASVARNFRTAVTFSAADP